MTETLDLKTDLPVKAAEYEAAIKEVVTRLSTIKVTDPTDKKQYELASTGRKELKAIRVGVSKYCKNDRDRVKVTIDGWMSANKDKEAALLAMITPEEERLEGEEQKYLDELERVRLAAERKENERIQARIAELISIGMAHNYRDSSFEYDTISISLVDVKVYNDEQFAALKQKVADAVQAAQVVKEERERMEREEKERLEAQRIQQEKERAELDKLRKEQEAREEVIRLREEAIRNEEEQKRLSLEREKNKRFLSRCSEINAVGGYLTEENSKYVTVAGLMTIERIKTAPDEDFNDYIKSAKDIKEKRKEEERIKRDAEIELAKTEAAAKAVKDAEDKRLKDEADKAEKERLAEAKEAKRLAAQPDKEKLLQLAKAIGEMKPALDLKTDEAKAILSEAKHLLENVSDYINTKAANL